MISAPLRTPASTTIVASARPLIRRLRCGNVPLLGGRSGNSSETRAPPVATMSVARRRWAAGTAGRDRSRGPRPSAALGGRRRHGPRRRCRPRGPTRRSPPARAIAAAIRAATSRPRSLGRRVPTIANDRSRRQSARRRRGRGGPAAAARSPGAAPDSASSSSVMIVDARCAAGPSSGGPGSSRQRDDPPAEARRPHRPALRGRARSRRRPEPAPRRVDAARIASPLAVARRAGRRTRPARGPRPRAGAPTPRAPSAGRPLSPPRGSASRRRRVRNRAASSRWCSADRRPRHRDRRSSARRGAAAPSPGPRAPRGSRGRPPGCAFGRRQAAGRRAGRDRRGRPLSRPARSPLASARDRDPGRDRRGALRLAPADDARPAGPAASSPTGRSGRGAGPRSGRCSAPATPRGQRAGAVRVAGHAARAGVHRGDELEPRGKARGAPDPGDRDVAVLERLAKGLQHVPRELRQLVEEQHAVIARVTSPGDIRGPPPTIAAYDSVWCGARTGARRRSRSNGPSPATDATIVAASASASSRGGSRPGIVRARSVLPEPGGPTSSRPCPPASAISSARRASSWPRTSDRSGTSSEAGSTSGSTASLTAGRRQAAHRPARAVAAWRGASGPAAAGRPRPRPGATRRRRPRYRRRGAPPRPSRPARATRRTPCRRRASTMGRIPGVGRTSPPSDSSPISANRPGRARTCSEPRRIPTAIARSSDAPVLRSSAGARLTVIRRGGWLKPAFRIAPRARSRASWSAASARPTIVNPGRPGATSTSTRITRPSRPTIVDERSVASTTGP